MYLSFPAGCHCVCAFATFVYIHHGLHHSKNVYFAHHRDRHRHLRGLQVRAAKASVDVFQPAQTLVHTMSLHSDCQGNHCMGMCSCLYANFVSHLLLNHLPRGLVLCIFSTIYCPSHKSNVIQEPCQPLHGVRIAPHVYGAAHTQLFLDRAGLGVLPHQLP